MFSPDIMKYIMYVGKRIWIVIIIAALLGGLGYWFLARQPPTYRAETRIFIGNALSQNPERNDVLIGLLLVPTYAEFAEDFDVITATIENLDLDMSPAELRSVISTRIVLDTPILEVRATTGDPELSANIANEVAENLIETSPSALTDEQLAQLDILSEQISELESQISITNDQAVGVLELLNIAQEEGNDREVEVLRERYNALVDQVIASRSTLASSQENYISLSNRVGRLEIVEYAQPPRGSTGFSPILVGIVGAIGGAGLSTALLLIMLEYFDNRIRTKKEIIKRIKLPVLGVTERSTKTKRNHQQYLTEGQITDLPVGENYRKIQTNLIFTPSGKESNKTYIMSSPHHDEGRTYTVANLASVMASNGLKVLLIDADLRSPDIHQLFSLDNTNGLTKILNSDCSDVDCMKPIVDEVIQETQIPTLKVITSGTDGTPATSRILGYDQFSPMIKTIRETMDYNIILVDTPACLEFADVYLIAGTLKSNIILVTAHADTSQADIEQSRDQFVQVGANIKGAILNKT